MIFIQSKASKALERVNQEPNRRTRVARLFPNEASLLRLISALLNKTGDERQTAETYLNMQNHPGPQLDAMKDLTEKQLRHPLGRLNTTMYP